MERYELENSREFKVAKELEHALNDYGWNGKRFAMAVTTFHRTLQQTLFRSMVEVIKIMGSEDYGYDLRNKASHEICKKIVESGVLEVFKVLSGWNSGLEKGTERRKDRIRQQI